MSFEYGTNVAAIISVLTAHNTTTASPDLSANLTTRITDANIRKDDPEIVVIRPDILPCIFVRLSNKDEVFAGIGMPGVTSARAKKEANVVYDIVGFYGKEGAVDSNENVLGEIYNLARNIEGVINQEFNMSGTCLWAAPVSTDFYGPFNLEGSWTKVCQVKMQAKYLYR